MASARVPSPFYLILHGPDDGVFFRIMQKYMLTLVINLLLLAMAV